MKMDEEIRKYIRPLICLRRAAAELEKMGEFELILRAKEFGVEENELLRFAHSKAENVFGGERGE